MRRNVFKKVSGAFVAGLLALGANLTPITIQASPASANPNPCAQTSSVGSGVGEVVTTTDGVYCYVAFKNTGAVESTTTFSWTVPPSVSSVDFVLIGGGGGGGAHVGAGGGAGGMIETLNAPVTPGASLPVSIGGGGRGAATLTGTDLLGAGANSFSTNGANSTFLSQTALGGGRGAFWWNGSTGNGLPGSGGSGGGGIDGDIGPGTPGDNTAGAAGTSGQGTAGGNADLANNVAVGGNGYLTGGGGGAAAAGQNANHLSTPKKSGDGGAGKKAAWLTPAVGTSLSVGQVIANDGVYFAGGGGGGLHDGVDPAVRIAGLGGVGGGGSGAGPASTPSTATAASGSAHTGGGGGGAGASAGPGYRSLGGAGGSGVLVVRYSVLSLQPVTGGIGSTQTLVGDIFSNLSDAVLVLSSKQGTLGISSSALTSSGATKTGEFTGSGFSTLSLRGSTAQLNAAFDSVTLTLSGPTTSAGQITAELVPVLASLPSNTFFSPATGRYYEYVPSAATYATALTNAAAKTLDTGAGVMRGYLTSITSATENTFIAETVLDNPAVANTSFSGYYATVFIGGREDGDGNYKWQGGPETGTLFSQGLYVAGVSSAQAVGGAFITWDPTEPNNNTAGAADCAVTNFRALGMWDDSPCTGSVHYVVEYGGLGFSDTAVSANVTVTTPIVYVDFTELDFDYAGKATALTGNGKALNNRVIYRGVTTRDGVVVDAVVTTSAISGANTQIVDYDFNTEAGGEDSYFEADIKIPSSNGFVEFTFDFYLGNTFGTAGQTAVILRDVNVSAIDIDYYQFNDFTGIEGYTLSSPSNVTIQNRTAPSSFPTDLRFQGRAAFASNDVRDMAVATYGQFSSFKIRFGTTRGGSNENLYGVAFKALPFGMATVTQGANYTLAYNGNGSTGGTPPASVSGNLGANITTAAKPAALVRTGFTFAGWNTKADGTGESYAAGSTYYMPRDGGTLYAQWTPQQFTLTYNPNSGTGGPSSANVNAGATTTLSGTVPTRSGFTFTGWNTLQNGSGTPYASSASFVMPSSNQTLWAQWATATGTLAYSNNGGTGTVTSQTGNVGSTAVVAAQGSVDRTGFTFSGWNTSAAGTGTRYAAGSNFTLVSGTTTLYAEWTPILYTLSYQSNGGTGTIAGSSGNSGASTTLAAGTNFTRSGYTFSGWNTNADGSGTPLAAGASYTRTASNVILYAQWSPVTYTLSYDPNGGTGSIASQTGILNEVETLATKGNFAYTGFKFVGWNTAADGSGQSYTAGQSFNMPLGGQVLYAVWIPNDVEIAYIANGGTGAPAPAQATYGQNFTISTTEPTRTGFTFNGWVAQDGTPAGTFKTSGTNSFVPATDEVLVAQWTAVDYTLSYNANSGTGAPASSTQNFNDSVTLSSTLPTRTGFTFQGWNTAANGSGTSYSASGNLVMPAQNLVLYAMWQGSAYTLSYSSNGGSGAPASESRNNGEVFQVSGSTPTRSGFTFSGWSTIADGSGQSFGPNSSITMGAQNVTLFAQWTVASYTITYNANSGSGAPAMQTFAFDANATLASTIPTRAGFTFLGWNTAQNGAGTGYAPEDVFKMPASNLELFAQWAVITRTVSYDANGGSGTPSTTTHAFGSTVTASSQLPSRQGFTFDAWNTTADGTGTRVPSSSTFAMPANNVVLFAVWIPSAFTMTFNSNQGTGAPAPVPGLTGANLTVPNTPPTRPGFTFSGWNTEIDGSGTTYQPGGAVVMPPNNLNLFAQWTAIPYTLSYNNNGGSGTEASQTGSVGSSQTIASGAGMTKSGFRLVGWNTEANGSGVTYSSGASLFMPLGGDVLYAMWIGNDIEIAYNLNGGATGPAAADATIGSAFTVSATVPTRAGYTFDGWKLADQSPTAAIIGANGSFTPNSNEILIAQWTPANYTLTFNLNPGGRTITGNAPSVMTVATDDDAALPGNNLFSAAGAQFLGWNTAADGTGVQYAPGDLFRMPAVNTILYAQWSAVFFVVEYNANGGSGEPADQLAASGSTVAVPATEPTLAGFDFDGWTKVQTNTALDPGDTFIMPAAPVLMVANWQASVSGGGNLVPPPVITTPITPAPTPEDEDDDSAEGSPGDSDNGNELANTGATTDQLLAASSVTIVVGLILLLWSRRRLS